MTKSESTATAEPAKAESGASRRASWPSPGRSTRRRERAETRLQRFLDAALELIGEGGPGKDFTVQEVVERSGQSLRLFYQYFGGKHELLLALFEESVRSTTEFLRFQTAEEKATSSVSTGSWWSTTGSVAPAPTPDPWSGARPAP